jgi:hypothetical protein
MDASVATRPNNVGFFEGRNFAVEIHAANENYSRLLEFAADLVRRQIETLINSDLPSDPAARACAPVIGRMLWRRRRGGR